MRSLFFVIIGLSIIVNVVLSYFFFKHDEIIPFKLQLKDKFGKEEINEWSKEVIKKIQPENFEYNTAELFDTVRNFVKKNSLHKENTIYHKNKSFITDTLIKDLFLYSEGERKNLPHISCTPSAWAMRSILKSMGEETRILLVYHILDSTLWSHTLIEVYNRQSKIWELHDPDLGVYYKDTVTNERLSFLAMKEKPSDQYVPCNGDTCSWDLVWYDWRVKEKMAIVKIYYLKEGYKDQVVFIDTRKINYHLPNFDWKAFFEGEKNVIEY